MQKRKRMKINLHMKVLKHRHKHEKQILKELKNSLNTFKGEKFEIKPGEYCNNPNKSIQLCIHGIQNAKTQRMYDHFIDHSIDMIKLCKEAIPEN